MAARMALAWAQLVLALTSALAPPQSLRLPTHVDDWAVEPTCSEWDGVALCCLTISNDPDVDGLLSVAHPEHPQFRARNELADPHGAVGVWPSSFVATAALRAVLRDRPASRVVELGAGAGLPSLYASVVGGAASVVATDVEDVPLSFLRAARGAHAPTDGRFSTSYLDVRDADAGDLALADADVVVAADMLYAPEVAAALGDLLGRFVFGSAAREVVVCDPGRRGREAFLDAFRWAADEANARFVDEPVPEGGRREDLFDGSPQPRVGLLRRRE